MTGLARLRIAAAALLLAGLPGVHLVELGYPFFSVEVLGLTALFGLAGAAVGWLLRNSGLYKLAFLAMLLAFLDVYFLSAAMVESLMARHEVLGLAASVLPFAGLLALLVLWRRIESQVLLIVPVFAFVFFLGGMATEQPDLLTSNGPESLPPGDPSQGIYVHLILDEQQSPLTPATDPAGDHPGRAMFDAYQRAGFRSYGDVQSISLDTYRSLGAVFGLTDTDDQYALNGHTRQYAFSIAENRLADHLQDAGYRVQVVQSNFLDLCKGDPQILCRDYTRAADMSAMETQDMSLPRRLGLAILALHFDWSNFGRGRDMMLWQVTAVKAWDAIEGERASELGFFSRADVVLDVIDQLERDFAAMQPGDALIAHLLMPHHPWVLDADCALKPVAEWHYPYRVSNYAPVEDVFTGFWDQSQCTNDRLLKALSVLDGRDDVTIVLHGDHGARIYLDTDQQNAMDNFTTFFAIRAPGVRPGIDNSPYSLPDLTTNALRSVVSQQVSEALDAPARDR